MSPAGITPIGSLNPRGPRAEEIDGLWRLMLWLGTGTFVLFAILLVVGLARRRVRDGDEFPVPVDEPVGRWWLGGGGVVLPSVVIGVVFVATVSSMQNLYRTSDEDPLVIEVTGQQWWWEASYPDTGVVTANQIHIPVDREIEIHLVSRDVIHSFWVPSLAGKIDALPDRVNLLVLEASEVGTHRGACAEFCGLQHAKMGMSIVALEADDFGRWMELQSADAEPAGAGLDVFLQADCGTCHTIRGTPADGVGGPDLTHVASRSTIVSGALPNERSSLEAWLTAPHAIKPGVDMPVPDLSPDELETLVSYLEALE